MGGGGELQGEGVAAEGFARRGKGKKSVRLMVLERKWMTSLRGGAQREEELWRR